MTGQAAVAMAAGFLAAAAWAAPGGGASPRVVEAVPADGDSAVDPFAREVRVVFDQAMDPSGYSFVGGGPTFPRTRGPAVWVDDRTCVLPVALEPDHEYRLGVNSDRFTNFRSAAGEPAAPCPLAFKTAPAAAPGAVLTAEDNRAAAGRLRRAVDREYAYRDLRRVPWDRLFREGQAGLERARTAAQFAQEAGRLLAPAQDLHLWIEAGGERFPSFRRQVTPNCRPAVLARLVPGWREANATVATGRYPDGIRYLGIASWDAARASDLEAAYAVLDEAAGGRGLVLDVRMNSGGSEPLARQVAGCFVASARPYARHVVRVAGTFTPPQDRVVEPTKDRPAFRGRVAVLMGPANMSSCESFLLMMKQAPECRLVGERSFGSSGNPQPVPLGNGVTAWVPVWQDLRPDGTCFEGEGLAPDVPVAVGPADLERGDPVLEAALRLLRTGLPPPPGGRKP